jgi:hypothetical protein
MDADAIATGHYARSTFGSFLENYDTVAGIHNFYVYMKLAEMASLELLQKLKFWYFVEIRFCTEWT